MRKEVGSLQLAGKKTLGKKKISNNSNRNVVMTENFQWHDFGVARNYYLIYNL